MEAVGTRTPTRRRGTPEDSLTRPALVDLAAATLVVQMRFVSLADINARKAAIKALIKDAIAVEKSGAKGAMKTLAQFEMAEEFQRRLEHDPKLAEAFEALTPGTQEAYVLHFGGAKQSATRAARVEKHARRILVGLGLDD